jgi:hypothetical protein
MDELGIESRDASVRLLPRCDKQVKSICIDLCSKDVGSQYRDSRRVYSTNVFEKNK